MPQIIFEDLRESSTDLRDVILLVDCNFRLRADADLKRPLESSVENEENSEKEKKSIEGDEGTVGQNSQDLGRKYWASRSSVHSFARTAHSFAGSALLALLAHSVALTRSLAPDCLLRSRPPLRSLIRSLAHFAHSLARGKVNY